MRILLAQDDALLGDAVIRHLNARVHHATIAIDDGPGGKGTAVRVDFPAAP